MGLGCVAGFPGGWDHIYTDLHHLETTTLGIL